MPIGEFAELSGLSPKRLRSYAAAGLLVPAAVDAASGYRYYAPSQLRDARLIESLRRAGVSLSEISQATPEAIDGWARRLDLEAAERRSALDAARNLLEARSSRMPRFVAASKTDIGRVRDTNEDVVLCRDHLVAVADGMGGLPGGEIAANLAMSVLAAFDGHSAEELAGVVRAANAAVVSRAGDATEFDGMGSTLCAVGITDDGKLAIVNVGDSRAYVVRDGRLRRLTHDHTVSAELVRRGELSEDEAQTHPHRRVLTRVLGGAPTVDVDSAVEIVEPGDRLLLCTDGLTNAMLDEEIRAIVSASDDITQAAEALVERALAKGGSDNVSVVVADVRS